MKDRKEKTSTGKYELTLAEFPLFHLSNNINNFDKLTYKDTISGENGEVIDREWVVSPASDYGMGTSSTFETMYELFQIWKEDNFSHQEIRFNSIYNILKRRGIKTEGKKEYTQIVRDLHCLVGITVRATNAFWDNETRSYVDMSFHLFDDLIIFRKKSAAKDGAEGVASIRASNILYESIKKNSLLTTDFDSSFFHSLTPVQQRLALYLSKVLKTKKKYSRELLKLADQIPIKAKLTKHIKQGINKACEGLISKGFKLLDRWEFSKASDGTTDLVIFYRKGSPSKWISKDTKTINKEPYQIDCLVEDILEVCNDKKSANFYRKVARCIPDSIIYRAIAEVKETSSLGEVKKSTGSIFTHLIKKYAAEAGIVL